MIDKIKQVTNKVKSFAMDILKTIKFLATPLGHVLGILVLVVFLIIVIYIISKTVENAVWLWFNDDYAGISTTEDYDTIVGGIGYAGYDSYISEEKWQEYAAFEYAVLMDVAEYLYENQDYIVTHDLGSGEKYYASAAYDAGTTISQYDASVISKSEWQDLLVRGQSSKAPSSIQGGSAQSSIGGNREVISPRLVYEVADNEYEESATSLMPYLVVVREDMELNYFLDGLDENNWENGAYGDYKDKINEGVISSSSSNINPIRYTPVLNKYNKDLPFESDEELADSILADINMKNVDESYGEEIYIFNDNQEDIVYKIPLKLLINRYLPKATLLTTWYMLKTDDGSGGSFEIDDLMNDIKEIYNAACYTGSSSNISNVIADSEKQEDGTIKKLDTTITLRNKSEDKESAKVNAIQFNEDGSIKRTEDGIAVKEEKEIEFAKTNNRTFIYFEQFGLETSRYDYLRVYKNKTDDTKPKETVPIANYLTKERVNFINNITLKIPNVTYNVWIDTDNDGKDDTAVKTTGDIPVELDASNDFMGIVNDAESIIKEKLEEKNLLTRIYKVDKNNKDDDEAMIYDHYVSNQLYILAEEDASKAGYYKTITDYSDYNQNNDKQHWYDLLEYKDDGIQDILEDAYLKAFQDLYADDPLGLLSSLIPAAKKDIISWPGEGEIDYKYTDSAPLYANGKNHDSDNMERIKNGNYKVNYYWKALYTIKEKSLQMNLKVYHKRMPALFVKYCDSWAKSTTYQNTITQNSLNYKNYKYLVPFGNTSLGLHNVELNEKSSYRVSTYKDYFNKAENIGQTGIKEADVLDMLVRWEDYAKENDDDGTTYAFMRDLYKLVIYIRDYGDEMLESAYSYLYIPSTISNFKDSTTQKVFWLERLGVTKTGDYNPSLYNDLLTDKQQTETRTKGNDIYFQNLEYDEYYECLENLASGKEEVNVYALFPYGSPYIRAYYMLANSGEAISRGFIPGTHSGLDMTSRKLIYNILNRVTDVGEKIYYYELNRLTTAYMNNGNTKEDAFLLAEEKLNSTLEEQMENCPIVAVAPGVVTDVNYNSRSGFYVKIKHNPIGENATGNKIETLYVHFKRWPLVEVGDYVGAGTILGYEGTTGKSTGNHLHFEVRIDGKSVDAASYIMPIFTPFYYDEKATAVLEENEERALGSEYYSLERTILLEDRLYNKYNVINGLTLSDGTVINYNMDTNINKPYKSGDKYEDTKATGEIIWGNNVPITPLSDSLDDNFMDLTLLNQNIGFTPTLGDTADITSSKLTSSSDITSNPMYFNPISDEFKNKLKLAKWYTNEVESYKSDLTVANYSGPISSTSQITSEKQITELNNLKKLLNKLGYYSKAGKSYQEDKETGVYSEVFTEVVKKLQEDLNQNGYSIVVDGVFGASTREAYNKFIIGENP